MTFIILNINKKTALFYPTPILTWPSSGSSSLSISATISLTSSPAQRSKPLRASRRNDCSVYLMKKEKIAVKSWQFMGVKQAYSTSLFLQVLAVSKISPQSHAFLSFHSPSSSLYRALSRLAASTESFPSPVAAASRLARSASLKGRSVSGSQKSPDTSK